MRKPKPWLVRLALSFALLIIVALAHTRSGEGDGFSSGLWHPASGLGVAQRWPAGRFSLRSAGALIALSGVVDRWHALAAGWA